MIDQQARLRGIFRYPVKGLSPEPLARADLSPGQTIAGDRIYAIENGPCGFDPAAPTYHPKIRFLMLMRNERLAELSTRFDHASHVLSVAHAGKDVATGDLQTGGGRAAIERFFSTFCRDELRGPPRILSAPGFSFSDVAAKVVSLINLATLRAVEEKTGARLNPLRFRANLYVDGWPAWREFDLLGEEIAIGRAARLRVSKRIVRCAATNVDPESGRRDLRIPETLMQSFGHADCGVYAEVTAAGRIAAGDRVMPRATDTDLAPSS